MKVTLDLTFRYARAKRLRRQTIKVVDVLSKEEVYGNVRSRNYGNVACDPDITSLVPLNKTLLLNISSTHYINQKPVDDMTDSRIRLQRFRPSRSWLRRDPK